MGLIVGILAILLVCFMILAMALAEWADKDVGDILGSWWTKWFPANKTNVPAINSPVLSQPQTEKVIPARVKPAVKKSVGKTKTTKRKTK
jgi:hypothetical protein